MSVTDLDQLQEIQLTLQEDATFSNGLWSLPEVLAYWNQRQYRFLFETKLVAAELTFSWIPGQPQMDLPPDWIDTILVGWHDLAAGNWRPLPPTDLFEASHHLGPEGSITVGPPEAYRESDTPGTLSMGLSPVPIAPGEVTLLYVALSETLDGLGTYFTVPDDWVPYIKYGVYSDMLGKDGRGQDLLRSRYAEQRYMEGIVLAQSLLQGWP